MAMRVSCQLPGRGLVAGNASVRPGLQARLRPMPLMTPAPRMVVCHTARARGFEGLMDPEQSQTVRFNNMPSTRNDKLSGLAAFWDKCKRAWAIFFPPESEQDGMVNRLRMVLMAERASMSPENFNLMKQSIVEAMREYVEVDEDEEVTVSFTTDPESGVVYCVAVPVKAAIAEQPVALDPEANVLIDEDDWERWDRDPAARFPYGT